jgi:hypothetical protein
MRSEEEPFALNEEDDDVFHGEGGVKYILVGDRDPSENEGALLYLRPLG